MFTGRASGLHISTPPEPAVCEVEHIGLSTSEKREMQPPGRQSAPHETQAGKKV